MELVAWERRINANLSAIQRAGCASVTYKDRFALILGGRYHDTFFLDCWSYDTTSGAINELSTGPKNCHPRAYHTATLIDGIVWVIGGSDDDAIHSNDAVWCFDVKTRVWTQPKLKGNLTLLHRTAHGACVHPTLPGCILLFGGYGIIQLQESNAAAAGGGGGKYVASLEPEWLSDLVLVDTRTNTVESVNSKGKAPIPRAYHSFSAVGNLCIALFGRTENKNLVPAQESVAVYDAQFGTWLDMPEKEIKGGIPQVRSSHRACSVVVNCPGAGSTGGGGILIFGGAPALASKKIDRLADLYYLKINLSTPVSKRRGGSSSGNSSSKFRMEWINCGDGSEEREIVGGGGNGDDNRWPIGRGAHAQEYINGKVCLFGGYCRHEKYCTDVWEGLVVVEGASQQPAVAGGADGAGIIVSAVPVGNDPTAAGGVVEAAPKWKSSRGRIENDNVPANILPSSTKRQRGSGGAGGVAGVKSNSPSPLPVAAAKRMKKQVVEIREIEAQPVVVNPPATGSPGVVPGARRISALEQEVKLLKEALVVQRSKEAALLRESKSANWDVFKLKEELQKADENWRKTAAERDDWKIKFDDRERFLVKAEGAKIIAVREAAAAEEKCQEALRRLKATGTIADQKQKALDAAAAQKEQLQNNALALQGALDQSTVATDKERQLRISIQEQNSVLQMKMATAETERNEFQRQLQVERTSLQSVKMQLEAEQGRLQRELSITKNSLSAAEREIEAAKRHVDKLESDIATLQDKNSVLQSKVQRLEADLRSVNEEREMGDAENKKLRGDLNRLQREMDDKQRSIDTEFDAIHRALQRARDTNAASGSRQR
jgi:Galactose oxidase, central domain